MMVCIELETYQIWLVVMMMALGCCYLINLLIRMTPKTKLEGER